MVMLAFLLPLLCVCLVHGQQGRLGEAMLDQRQYQGGAMLDQRQYQGGPVEARNDQMQYLQYQEAGMDLQYPEQEEVEGVNIPGSPGR